MSLLSFLGRSEASASSDAVEAGIARRSGNATSESGIDELLTNSRYGLILNRHNTTEFEGHVQALAWVAMEKEMALVPEKREEEQESITLSAFYLDRFAVTNRQFARFIADGGYSQTEYWPREIWPNLLQFVDSTGYAGPRFWSEGKCPRGKESHPVVGISWFEARAFALWCGKRLPTSTEWQHAASWASGKDGRGRNIRYPWGNTFSPEKTNTWAGGPGTTVPVDQHYEGCTPNGVYQLIGNVWEWVATQFQYDAGTSGMRVSFEQPLAEIRGGAFDTYFETQATCQFKTGQPFLSRTDNLGFRCCLPANQLREPPSPTDFD